MRWLKKSIIGFLVLIAYWYITKKGFIDINILDSNHFNLITINTVFAGFLFTALAMIVGLSTQKIIIRIERANFMEVIYRNIIMGIYFSVISIGISLFNIFINPVIVEKLYIQSSNIKDFFTYTMPGLELLFLLLTIIAFMLSVKDVIFIIKSVRLQIRNEFPNKENIKKTTDLIK